MQSQAIRSCDRLEEGSEKVIDIAMKYGYESADAFSAAFKKFHGATPQKFEMETLSDLSWTSIILKDYRRKEHGYQDSKETCIYRGRRPIGSY